MNYESLLETIRHRQSCRSYDPGREVTDTDIRKILEAARLAPSACNKQPWRIIVVRDAATRLRICREGILPGLAMNWLEDAPVILTLCVQPAPAAHWLAPILSGIQYQLVDLGIAGQQMALAIDTLGLASCWIGWFSPKKVRAILGIPKSTQPAALFALGYAKERREPTPRLNMDAIAFRDRWGQPLA